jgi:hypothetical protein
MNPVSEASGARLSRRNLLLATTTAVAGAGVVFGALDATPGLAAQPVDFVPPTETLGAAIANLAYTNIDAVAFQSAATGIGTYYDPVTGRGLLIPPERVYAPLSLPVGSVVRQLNIAYQGTPIVEINRRQFSTPAFVGQLFQQTATTTGGVQTMTFNLASPVTIEANATYTISLYFSPGDTVYGMTVGYTPATQSFIPFVGSVPRALDTRDPGPGKLTPNEERVVALGNPGARSAVINLTVTATEGTGGFVAAFRADIAWPNNSSINWAGPNQNLANGVLVALDGAGQIRIRGGAANTHVIIDRIGWFV